jgi:iron complex outermembrane receptor protein
MPAKSHKTGHNLTVLVAMGALVILFQLTLCASAAGASAPNELQEIVVTAEKRESTVQKTPISITAITGQDLLERGVNTAQELAMEVPGLAVESLGPGQGQYQIRGLTAIGGESATVGFYLDEISMTPPVNATVGKVSIDPDLYDLERVEVLRGPQGTLYGSGSMGGTIKLVTSRPDPSSFRASSDSTVSGTDGGGVNYGQKGMVNLPLIDDKLALRIVGIYTHTSGWIDRIVVPGLPVATNPIPGFYGATRGDALSSPASHVYNKVNDEDLEGARASLLFKPTDRLSITAGIFYQRITVGGPSTFDSDPGTLAHYEPFDIAEPFSDQVQVDSLTISLALDPFTITSATGYWDRRSRQTQDISEEVQQIFQLPSFATAGGLGLGAASIIEENHTRQFSQEVRLTSNNTEGLQWILGGYYSNYFEAFIVDSYIPGLLTLGGGGVFPTDIFVQQNSPFRLYQRAAFGNLSYKFDSAFKITAGLRYYNFGNSVAVVESGVVSPSGDATTTSEGASASNSGVNPMMTLSYSVTNDLLLYATAAKGYREGASNFPIPTTGPIGSFCEQNLQALGRTQAPLEYDPDTVWSYEIGEKGKFLDQRLTVNADVYYLRWSKVQVPISLPCGYSYIDNAATAAVEGGELEIHANLTEGLSVIQNAGYTFAKYIEDVPAANIVAGERLLDVPMWTISTILKFEHKLEADRSLFVVATNSFISKQQDLTYGVNNLPSRDLTAIRLGVQSKRWSGTVFVDNLFNKQLTVANMNTPINLPSYNRVATNQPLTVGLEFSATF